MSNINISSYVKKHMGSKKHRIPDSQHCFVRTVDVLKQDKRIWVLFPFKSILRFPKPSLSSMLVSARSYEIPVPVFEALDALSL
jgi:hypothetical protein